MPSDDDHHEEINKPETPEVVPVANRRDIFATPAPIKRLFANFPLLTYPAQELPLRSPRRNNVPVLYIFTTSKGACSGAPSFNPSCLKWQAYLKFLEIDFITLPSNNHASSTGSLPLLLPTTNAAISTRPVRSSAIQKWALHSMVKPPRALSVLANQKQNIYLALLDGPIRLAYLHALYLNLPTFLSVAQPCYINPSSSNALVRLSLSHSLLSAAEAEILASCKTPRVDIERLYRDAEDAFEALSELLEGYEWFEESCGQQTEAGPGLLDAAVFAYTHFFRRAEMMDMRLGRNINRRENLVKHCENIVDRYFLK